MLPDWNRFGATPRRAVPLTKRRPKHPPKALILCNQLEGMKIAGKTVPNTHE